MTIALISVIIVAVVTCLSITFSKDREIAKLYSEIRKLQDELRLVKTELWEKRETKDDLN